MKTLKSFILDNHIRLEDDDIQFVDENPNMADRTWQAHHYKVTLRARINGKARRMTVYFSQGMGIYHDPRVDDVLDCLASDASGIDNARSFEDWAADYGYDTDSRKSELVYRNCQKAAARLRKFLGSKAYETLTTNTERL